MTTLSIDSASTTPPTPLDVPRPDPAVGAQGLEVFAGAYALTLPLEEVQGVARQVPLVAIPDAVDPVLGLANVRGTLVTVLALERLLAGGVTPGDVTVQADSIVLLSRWDGRVALAVDRCGQVAPLTDAAEATAVTTLVAPWLAEAIMDDEGDR